MRAPGGRPLVEPVRRPAQREAGPRPPGGGHARRWPPRSARWARWRCWPSAPGRCSIGQLSLGACWRWRRWRAASSSRWPTWCRACFARAGARLPRPHQRRPAGRARADRRAGASPRPLSGRIELEQVSFRYDPARPWWCARSTCASSRGSSWPSWGARARARPPWPTCCWGCTRPARGGCCSTAIDLAELDLRSVRQQLGVVNQSFALFGATIRENIALLDPAASLAEVEAPPGWPASTTRSSALPHGLRDRCCSIAAAPLGRAAAAAGPGPGPGPAARRPAARRGHQRAGRRDRAAGAARRCRPSAARAS